jgi:hypothetical protein
VALAVLGVVAIFLVLPLLAGFVIFSDGVDPKPRGYGLRLVLGLALVVAGVAIIFLPVSTDINAYAPTGGFGYHADCGTALGAMFNSSYNGNYECGSAAFPYLWIAGGVAAVGMGVAFWGDSRGRLLAVVCIPLLVAGFIALVAFMNSDGGVGLGGN